MAGATPDPHRAHSYLVAFALGGVVSVVLFFGALMILNTFGRLPPPPVSGTWCIDSRFAWLRREWQWKQATVLAVGSSTTLRNLDFGAVPPEMANQRIVNAAPCFLTINQTRHMAEFLLERAPATKTLMTVLTPRDLEGCARNPTAFFDAEVADRYIGRGGYAWWLYFRNFRLKDIFFYALYAGERRDEIKYDKFGSGPMTRDVPDTGRPFAPEARCFAELRSLATMLESRNIQFIVVTFPVMQGWSKLHDSRGEARASFRAGVQSALVNTKAILVDGMSGWRLPDASFADPVHLQWPETAAFTRFVWSSARRQGADLRGHAPHSELDVGRQRAEATTNRFIPDIKSDMATLSFLQMRRASAHFRPAFEGERFRGAIARRDQNMRAVHLL